MFDKIYELLGKEKVDDLLSHKCTTISKERLKIPSPDFIDQVFIDSDRSPNVLRNLQSVFSHGRLKDTGYLSILPVDQGIEHSG
ncbi:MAG: fructose-bisphosphate aldolase, partial [Deltaproteobacteria bacterium]